MKLNVLFLPVKEPEPRFMQASRKDVVEQLSGRHQLTVFDHNRPLGPQFDRVDVVIDHGGLVATRPMADRAAGQVKLWQILGTGIDHFDLPYWRTKGIPVANCPGTTSAAALADLAMMFILVLARRFPMAPRALREQLYNEPMGRDLAGLKLGIVGFGASGKLLAQRAAPFGLRIAVIDVRDVAADEVATFGLDFAGKPADLDKVVSESDFLSLHVHLTDKTRHMIDQRRLELMKPTAILINVARGALVDEDVLVKALVNERIGGAGVDVFTEEPPDVSCPLFHLETVAATYHCAGVTDGTSRRRAALALENVDRVARNLDPLHRVDR